MAETYDAKFGIAVEKLSNISCYEPDNIVLFAASYRSYSTAIQASSHFECAYKFGCFLREIGEFDNDADDMKTLTCKLSRQGEREVFSYDIWLRNGVLKTKLKEMFATVVNCDSTTATSTTNGISTETSTSRESVVFDASRTTTEELVMSSLRCYFGFTEFKPLQKEIILETLTGKSVLAVLGTGGGKSLTFMLPAILSSKPTLVVSPIKALIDDMLARSTTSGIPACAFTGDTAIRAREEQYAAFGNFKMIFCTPEMLVSEDGKLFDLCKSNGVARIVLDEAHTVCTWGSTFRPQYKAAFDKLCALDCAKLMLSATVPQRIQEELLSVFIEEPVVVLRHSIFRENLVFEVKERPSGGKFFDDMASFINERPNQAGIVYCVLPSDVAKVHAELIKRNIDCKIPWPVVCDS